MIKCAVISDLHIKNNSRIKEYDEYFYEIYNELKKLKLDCIFFTGDLFHSKTVLSPNSVTLAQDFMQLLSDCADFVFIILGNHDCNEKNLEKLDAISAIYNISPMYKVYFLKQSECKHFKINDQNVHISSFSILDKYNWENVIEKNKKLPDNELKIGLYHGPLKGAKTDLGFVFSNADDVSKYDCLDFMFCGDIHSHYTYDGIGRKVSIGNPIQQDFGENIEKGFLYYEITDSHNFDYKFIKLKNLYPFITLNVGDNIPELSDAKGIRIRIVSETDIDSTDVYVKQVKNKYNTKIISLSLSRKPLQKFDNSKSKNIISYKEYIDPLYDNEQKKELIQLYERFQKELHINNSNSNWKILKIKWNNLFSYSEDNNIDFQDLTNKTIGIFGSNFSGKTSLIDVICFSLFGSWTKPFIKNIFYINDNKKFADSEIILKINGEIYKIYRKLEKTGKTSKNIIQFFNISKNENLNCDTVTETQSLIEKYIGTKEQFMLSSLSTQFNNFSILDEKNTKRKEYFSIFLGIDKYSEIYKLAKSELDNKYKELDFVKNISGNIDKNENNIKEINDTISKLSHKKSNLLYERNNHKYIAENYNKEIDEILQEYQKYQNEISLLQSNLKKYKDNIIEKVIEENLPTYEDLKNNENEISEEILKLKQQILINSHNVKQNEYEIERLKTVIKDIQKNESLLNSIPCGDKFPNCMFIHEAMKRVKDKDLILHENKEKISVLEYNNSISNSNIEFLQKEIKQKQEKFEYIKKTIEKVELNERLNKKANENRLKIIEQEELLKNKEIEFIQFQVEVEISNKLGLIQSTIGDKCKELQKQYSDSKISMIIIDKDIANIDLQMNNLKKDLEIIIGNIKLINDLRKQIGLLEYFCGTVGKNGISVKILQDYIPIISSMVNTVISNFADFYVDIKIDDDKYLEIYLTDNMSTRLIESCSGSQKTIVAYALRVALLYYSQISSSDLFILDEPATSFDEHHLAEFDKLLQMIKMDNKTILLVTHIQSLKDCVDVSFVVDKSTGYSKISV